MFKNTYNYVFCMLICIYYVKCNHDLPEGAPCEVTKEVNGTCYSIRNCISAIIDLKNKRQPKICSFRGSNPVVCCTDCEKVNDTRTIIVDTDNGVFFKIGQKARDNCVEYAASLPYTCQTFGLKKFLNFKRQCDIYEEPFRSVVVGGSDAERFKYPHMALLGYGKDSESAQWLCGGSLISNKFILTAAHCKSDAALGPVSYVALGLLKRTDSPELWQRYKVLRVIPHPAYKSPSKYHDIALLEIEPVRKFSTAVFPSCLHFDEDFASKLVTATGWGSLGKNKPLADVLQEVKLFEFSEQECAGQYPEHRHMKRGYDHRTQRCYGDSTDIKDTCQGDSGGPIQVTSSISKCLWTIIGVASSGRQCGYAAGDTGLYSRVLHYLPWIESVVWP